MSSVVTRTVAFRQDTRNLFVHLLTRCNLRCRHCYINPGQHGTGVMDAEAVHSLLALFASRSFKDGEMAGNSIAASTNLVLLGGEPTLHPDLPRFISFARELGYRSITVDSNGFLFNDFLRKVPPEMVDNLSFSLDGPSPAVNDPIRGKGVFDTVVTNISRAVERGFPVSVIFTANRLNVRHLPGMVPLLQRLGVTRFFIQVVGLRGRAGEGGETSLQLSREEWDLVVPASARSAAEAGIWVTYPKVFLGQEEEFQCAGVVAENYFVFPNGRVYTCPLCEDYPLHAYEFSQEGLVRRPPITEMELFSLTIPEGCVLNKLLHPGNIEYRRDGSPAFKVACCMLKEELVPEGHPGRSQP